MSPLNSLLLISIPTLPLLAGLLARNRRPCLASKLTVFAASLSAALALVAIGLLVTQGAQTVRWSPLGFDDASAISLRLDAVSAAMAALVSFLGAIVLRFSRQYLAGEPGKTRFFSWLSLTLASVLMLVLSGNLLLILIAWVANSLCLHQLLLHYPNRAGAIFSARKKFVVSRLGDACLLAAVLTLHAYHGTFDLDALFASISAGNAGGIAPAGLLLAVCVMCKSAQLPFHSWLPDTMETPTPVSAFMHAGIINAGGFLVVRLAPVFAAAPLASNLLAVVGALTAAFGAIVMLAQPSVKRALAYSTIAQMGFMVLQCGLGAYGLAMLHIVAHSLYKAHAFLTTGSTIGAVPRAAVPLHTPALTIGLLAGGLVVALGATLLHVVAPTTPAHLTVFAVILALALAYGVARAWSSGAGSRVVLRALVAAGILSVLSLGLHSAATALFTDLPSANTPPALLIAIAAIFAGLFFFQALLWRANAHPLGRRIYVHALNGFYLGTLFNRLLGQLWPKTSSSL